MAPKELKRTPIVEVQWCKLLGAPRPPYDPEKPPEWSIEILLDRDNEQHMQWVGEVEKEYETHHGDAKKSVHWCPVKPYKEDPLKRLSCRMKIPQFINDNGVKSEGPTVYGPEGEFWDHSKLIGNGSKMQLSYTIYAWGKKGGTGSGISLEPRGAQVKEWLAAPESVKPITASDHGFTSTKAADAKVLDQKNNPVMNVSTGEDSSRWNTAPLVPDDDDLPF